MRFTKKEFVAIGVLATLALIGIGAWIHQITEGLIVTNMRNIFAWGLYIATFTFLVGTAAGGLITSSAVYLFNVKTLKPLAPLASLTAFVCVLGAMAMILPDLGRPERIFYILMYPNTSSLLVWDFIVLTTYAVLSGLHVYLGYRPIAARRKGLSETEIERIRESSEKLLRILAPFSLPFAVLIHTVTAWIFAVLASRPWWYGGYLAPSFIASAVVSGTAVVILTSLVAYGLREDLKQAYSMLSKLLATSIGVLLFLVYNDYLVKWWWESSIEKDILSVIFRDNLYLALGELLIPLVALIIAIRFHGIAKGLVGASTLALVGVFVHRYILMPPAWNVIPLRVEFEVARQLTKEPIPIVLGELRYNTSVLVSYWPYTPSIIEWLITIGWLSGVALFLLILGVLLFREGKR